MENVSKNTSYESVDDNLSRASNQQPFVDEENVQSNMHDNSGETQRATLNDMRNVQMAANYRNEGRIPLVDENGQRHHEVQSHMVGQTGFFMARSSLQDTEHNPYGFAASETNPMDSVTQVHWQEFQRREQAMAQLHQEPHNNFDPNAVEFTNENMSLGQLSRPTAVFGNSSNNLIGVANYADDNDQRADGEVTESMNSRQRPDNLNYDADRHTSGHNSNPRLVSANEAQFERLANSNGQTRIMTEQAVSSRQPSNGSHLVYREEFARRYYPNQSLHDQFTDSQEPANQVQYQHHQAQS